MATHIFRDSTGLDLFSFRIAGITAHCDKKIRYMQNYQDVVILNDITGYLMKDDGVTVDETKPYTIKAGTRLDEYNAYYIIQKNGNQYLSLCVENEDDLFEVRVNL